MVLSFAFTLLLLGNALRFSKVGDDASCFLYSFLQNFMKIIYISIPALICTTGWLMGNILQTLPFLNIPTDTSNKISLLLLLLYSVLTPYLWSYSVSTPSNLSLLFLSPKLHVHTTLIFHLLLAQRYPVKNYSPQFLHSKYFSNSLSTPLKI